MPVRRLAALLTPLILFVHCAQQNASTPDQSVSIPDQAAAPIDLGVPPGPTDLAASDAEPAEPGCLPGMARIAAFCVDRYEAFVVEVTDAGAERPHSPYDVIGAAAVRAKNARGSVPQGYISQVQATDACRAAGKRLCSASEFALACRGSQPGDAGVAYYPYGGTMRVAGACNEGKGSSVARFFGSDPQKWTYANFNDPRLNQWDGGLAPSGSYPKCVSPFGVADCVGNLHEWGSDPPDQNNHGRFRGGFYGDAEINGKGCLYVTSAHDPTYHDYSTGFRCCMDAR